MATGLDLDDRGAIDTIPFGDDRFDVARALRSNAFTFAVFKNHANVQDIVRSLRDPNTGKLRTFSQFRKAAMPLMREYNQNWLQAEYQTSVTGSRMALKWQRLEKDSDVFPFLRYDTVGDSKVRASHRSLDGITRPINDPFWDSWYPPNGFRCRCDVVPRTSAGDQLDPSGPLPDNGKHSALFMHNVGKSLEVFNDKHPYRDGVNIDDIEIPDSVQERMQDE